MFWELAKLILVILVRFFCLFDSLDFHKQDHVISWIFTNKIVSFINNHDFFLSHLCALIFNLFFLPCCTGQILQQNVEQMHPEQVIIGLFLMLSLRQLLCHCLVLAVNFSWVSFNKMSKSCSHHTLFLFCLSYSECCCLVAKSCLTLL